MIELHNIDCMELMQRYPDDYFDLAIVDPPYGIKMSNKIREQKIKNWDNEKPNINYFENLKRVSKNQIIWGANYFPSLWVNGCRGFIFWDKMTVVKNFSCGELAYTSLIQLQKNLFMHGMG